MIDDVGSNDEFVAQNVFTGEGETLDEALADAARHALRRHPEGTPFEVSRTWCKIRNPHVTDYRVILTKSGSAE